VSYPIYPQFSFRFLDPRSDLIQCTDLLLIQYDKLFNLFPVHIKLTQPILLFGVPYLPVFQLLLLPVMLTDLITCA
jgi:hypothetical protein